MINIPKLIILLLFVFPSFSIAEIKEIVSEGTYNMGDGETPTVAESRALLQAKRVAIEQAGTYIESYSKIKNYQLTHDEIQVLASGVMEVTILEKKRTVIEDGFKFWVKIKARVSTDKIEEMAKKVRDKSVVEDYKRLQKDYDKLAKDMELLKGQLKEIASEEENREVKVKITGEENLFQVKLLMEKGWQHYINGDYDSSIEALKLAIALNPNSEEGYMMLSRAYFSAGKKDLAIECLNKAIDVNPNSAKAYLNRGIHRSYTLPDYDRALEDYDRAISLDPKLTAAYLMRGWVFEKQGQFERAMKEYNEAISIDSKQAEAYCKRGLLFEKKGHFERAMKEYNEAISIDSNYIDAYYDRAKLYQKKGEYELAIKDYNRTVDRFLDAYFWIGDIYFEKGQIEKANKEYSKAIAKWPDSSRTYYQRGLRYIKQNKYELALKDLNQAIRIDPDGGIDDYYLSRGDIFFKKGQYSKALEDYNQHIKIQIKDIKETEIEGESGFKNVQEYQKYLSFLTDALAEPYLKRGTTYHKLGKFKEAIQDTKTAAQMGNKDAQNWLSKRGISW